MKQFEQIFTYPAVGTRVVFGFGVLDQLSGLVKEFGAQTVMMVTDPGFRKIGIVDSIAKNLKNDGIGVSVFDKVPQDSSTDAVEQAFVQFSDDGAQLAIGIGGGSSLDFAKAVGIRATNPAPMKQYAGLNKVKNQPIPVIAIPTTAGTGSEISFWSIMTDDDTKVKIGIGGDKLFPRVALCDPELTVSLPPFLTATTGMDALAHAIESYTNKSFQPVSAALTYRAMELIGKYLVRAVENGKDREARYGMMLGSTLAGMGMNPTRLGLVHAIAMPLGSWELKIAHGTGVATLLAEAMEWNLSGNPQAYAEVAVALGESIDGLNAMDAGGKAVDRVRVIARETGIPKGLGVLGLTKETIPRVCKEAMKSGNIAVNPRFVTQADLESLCRKLL